jgi:DNA (cytosine-5)-methyltransferase 1
MPPGQSVAGYAGSDPFKRDQRNVNTPTGSTPPLTPAPSHRPTSVSLFSGSGGLDLGAERAGVDLRVAVETSPHACETLRLNFPSTKVLHGDVRDYCYDDLMRAGVPEDLDLVIGGPPCTPFTQLKPASHFGADQRTAHLLFDYFRIVDLLCPRAFILENVPGLIRGRFRTLFDAFLERSMSGGYNVFTKVLDAADFGVPQHRKRVFVVGIRGAATAWFTWPDPSHGPSSCNGDSWVTAGEALEGLLPPESEIDASGRRSSRGTEVLKDFAPGENERTRRRRQGASSAELAKLFATRNRKLDPAAPSPTVLARSETGVHWTTSEPLRNDQLKRLQGFPDSFHFVGPPAKVRAQIGNAVPPLLAQQLAWHTLVALRLAEEPWPEEEMPPSTRTSGAAPRFQRPEQMALFA